MKVNTKGVDSKKLSSSSAYLREWEWVSKSNNVNRTMTNDSRTLHLTSYKHGQDMVKYSEVYEGCFQLVDSENFKQATGGRFPKLLLK